MGTREALYEDAARRAARYLDGLGARSVEPRPEDVSRLQELTGPLPEAAGDAGEILRLLDEVGSPATLATAGPRFFGWVVGGALPVTVAANWLATAWDQNAASWDTSPTAAALEEASLQWLADILGLPPGSGGTLVT